MRSPRQKMHRVDERIGGTTTSLGTAIGRCPPFPTSISRDDVLYALNDSLGWSSKLMRSNGIAMLRIRHWLYLAPSLGFIAMLVGSAMAEDRVRSPHFDEAVALFSEGKLERAIEAAYQAWSKSREAFGPEDTRTFEAEALWLSLRIQDRGAAELSYDDLAARLSAVRDKSIVRREIAYEMSWRYGQPGKEWPDAEHVILTYVAYPNYFEGFYSSELADYLAPLRGRRICVVLSVTYDAIGEIMGHRIVEIGDITQWKSSFSYGGKGGAHGDPPSPWQYVNQGDAQCPRGAR